MMTSALTGETKQTRGALDGVARLFGAAVLGGAIAAVANVALFLGAQAAGVALVARFDPSAPPTALPLPMILVASLVPALVAALGFTALRAFTTRANRVFVALTLVLLAVSMGGPASLGDATVATKLVLVAMHVTTALFITGALVRANRRD